MSTLIPIATLSLNGWVKSGAAKADYLLSYFFTSNYSQTNLYRGKIASLQWLIFRYGQDPNTLVTQITQTLTSYLNRAYPEGVYVNCTHNANTSANPSNTYAIQLIIEISENDQIKSLGKLVNYDGSRIVSILDLNNTGATS